MTPVHLVGSVALDSVDEVFDMIGQTVGPYIKRCPDGEMGGRRGWISWQWPVLRTRYFIEPIVDGNFVSSGFRPLRLRRDVDLDNIEFGELCYAREARASYQDFRAARERGTLPKNARFQVSLPTPLGVIGTFLGREDHSIALPAYERAMLAEVARACAAIPHEDLAIQWDVALEMCEWDNRLPHLPLPENADEIYRARFKRLCAPVPPGVELGIHLCYGDLDGKHGIEPLDLRKAVELANLIVSSSPRPIQWVHMPVPISRDDDAYFSPLTGLRLGPETELYLGLVHPGDGAEGTLRRMRVADKYVSGYGIATECGLGRAKSPDTVRKILRIHAEVAAATSA